MVENDNADIKLTWNDFSISRKHRKSYTYPDYIQTQREELKAAEKLAIALGEAETKISTFWEVRLPKP